MVWKFYASYATIVLNTLPKRKKPLAQSRVTHIRVSSRQVDILETTTYHMLFGPDFSAPRSTVEYDHKLGKTKDKALIRDQSCKASLMRWVVAQITK